MFLLYFPASKGSVQKASSEAVSALFVCFRYVVFPHGKPPSSQWVLCCCPTGTRAVLQSASPARYQLGKGFVTPTSPGSGGTCGWSPAWGSSPALQQTELILSTSQWRCILKEHFWAASRNVCVGWFYNCSSPHAWIFWCLTGAVQSARTWFSDKYFKNVSTKQGHFMKHLMKIWIFACF